jgi:hypothetical protein
MPVIAAVPGVAIPEQRAVPNRADMGALGFSNRSTEEVGGRPSWFALCAPL